MNKIITFHDFEIRETKSALGGTRRQAFDKTGEHYELREVFDAYMRFGGMPGIADVGLDQEKALGYLRVSTQLLLWKIFSNAKIAEVKRESLTLCFKKIVIADMQ